MDCLIAGFVKNTSKTLSKRQRLGSICSWQLRSDSRNLIAGHSSACCTRGEKGSGMFIDFFRFVKKLFLGQYDEMGWEDMFHGLLFIILTSGLVYAVT